MEFGTKLTDTKQQRPNTRSWTLWKQMLPPLIIGRQLKISRGQWKNNHCKTGTWNAYCKGSETYQHTPKHEQKWQRYKIHGTHLRWSNSTDDYTPKIDSTPIRTKVFSNGKIYVDLAAVLLEKPQEQQLDQQ